MITAKELISENIPIITPLEQGKTVLNWMEIYKVSQLPIVENDKLFAIISENDIYNLNEPEKPVGDYPFNDKLLYIYEYQHIYDAINIMSDNKLTVLPVLDENKTYVGSIMLQDILPAIKHITSSENTGGIIVLEMHPNNYSLTEIANIVESEEGKIVSLYINNNVKSNKLYVNLKINKDDLTTIIKSLERYNYKVKVSYCNNNSSDTIYEDRYNELMHYLNI
jgi:predicted transcriptional regulator